MAKPDKYHVTHVTLNTVLGRFDHKLASEEQIAHMAFVRDGVQSLAEFLLHNTRQTREQSIALTHLEEAAMWANKAITHGDS